MPIVAVASIIAVGFFLYSQATAEQPNVQYVGETAKAILDSVETQQRNFDFLDETTRQAAQTAVREQVVNHGFQNQTYIETNCEELIHPMISGDCEWQPQKHLAERTQSNIQSQIQRTPYSQSRFLSVTTSVNLDETMTVSVESDASIPTVIEKTTTTEAKTTTGSNQNAWGEPLVSLNDLNNINCQATRSCTGYQRQCQVKPGVYNQLQELDGYLQANNLQMTITQSTRSWEMQNAFYQEEQRCESWKDSNCDGLSDQECTEAYAEYLDDKNIDACATSGRCVPACNPGPNPNQPRRACTHMTGNAIDVAVQYNPPNGKPVSISNKPDLHDNLRKTMCQHGFINFYQEQWHYEYKTEQWQNRYEKGQSCAYYADEVQKPNWASVTPLGEALQTRYS